MKISVQQFNQVSVMTVIGRVDSDTVPTLEDEIRKLIDADSTQIVLDLGGVEYLSSAGVHALFSTLKDVKRLNGDLRLCSLSPQAAEALQLARMDSAFSIYPSQLKAVSSY